ncbi:hypothetical protein V5E97_24970 [Singulisphaera sp. Ch08]|uniref:Peptidase C-terminal archaeal/bacterial domain-containing protein n=1 Tax=Singulisphaera sp. Ch08 TaxID=3120278 RepID=A0AAU7C8Z4_9BACT
MTHSCSRLFLERLETRLVCSASTEMGSLAQSDIYPTPTIETIASASVRDLGDLPPAASTQPIKATAWIAPGESVTFRFVATFAADYTLYFRYLGDQVQLNAVTPGGTVEIAHGPAGPYTAVPLSLAPGEYFVTAVANGDGPVFVDWDLVLSNGVGQATALNLQLLDDSATPVMVVNSAPERLHDLVSLATSTEIPLAPATTASTQATQLTLGLGGTLSGRPVADLHWVAAVGPADRGRTVSLASLGEDILPGINYGRLAQDQGDEAVAQPTNGALVITTQVDDLPTQAQLPKTLSWMERMAMIVASWAEPTSPENSGQAEPAIERFDIPAEDDRTPTMVNRDAGEEKATARAGLPPLSFFSLGIAGLVILSVHRHWQSQRLPRDRRGREPWH